MGLMVWEHKFPERLVEQDGGEPRSFSPGRRVEWPGEEKRGQRADGRRCQTGWKKTAEALCVNSE